MNTKSFFTKIREIIREEIEYAIDKKINQKQTKKDDVSTFNHGISIYKEQHSPKNVSKTKKQKTEFGSIQELLAETRRSIEESYETDDEFTFTADMADGFGRERLGSAIPQGYNASEIPSEVMSALTKDYSSLMKKIEEKKGR